LAKLTVGDIEISGKKVLMRVDFNVPLDENGNVSDDTRIKAALPTINYVIENNAELILVSHLGRPGGGVVEGLKMDVVARRLEELLGRKVQKLNDCIGAEVEEAVRTSGKGDVILLENVRFHEEEEKNDPHFAGKLAKLADVFVNDAFGTCHRAHASTEGVARILPAVAGFLVEKELKYFQGAFENPLRPFAAILGGAKLAGKIEVIENLIDKVNVILIGGGMAYTFLKAKGLDIGDSLFDESRLELAGNLQKKADKAGIQFLLPVDHVVADDFSASAKIKNTEGSEIASGWRGMDIGQATVKRFIEVLKDAGTVMWNGPLGVCEFAPFSAGTMAVAEYLSGSDAVTILGGGDTAAAVNTFGLASHFNHVSTGGGASLEFMEGKDLPGIVILKEKI